MNNNNDIAVVNVLQSMNAIVIKASCVTNQRSYDIDALPMEVRSKIPPATLASLGAIKYIDGKYLKVFDTLKARAENAIMRRAIQLLGPIYLIPATDEVMLPLLDELRGIQVEWEQAKVQLLLSFDAGILARQNEFPDWSHLIVSLAPTKGYIEDQIDFDWTIFQIGQAAPSADATVADGLKSQVTGLTAKLYGDIAKQVGKLQERNGAKDKVSTRALGPIASIAEKLKSLAFLHPSVRPMADYCRQMHDELKAVDGSHLTGYQLMAFQGMLSTLSDHDKIMAFCEQVSSQGATQVVKAQFADAQAKTPSPVPLQSAQVVAPAQQGQLPLAATATPASAVSAPMAPRQPVVSKPVLPPIPPARTVQTGVIRRVSF